MSDELVFASVEDAIQHLSDKIAQRVVIAEETKEEKEKIPVEHSTSDPQKAYELLEQHNDLNSGVKLNMKTIEYLRDIIKKHPMLVSKYVYNIVKDRFKEAEEYIEKDPDALYDYLDYLLTKEKFVPMSLINKLTRSGNKFKEVRERFMDKHGYQYADDTKKKLKKYEGEETGIKMRSVHEHQDVNVPERQSLKDFLKEKRNASEDGSLVFASTEEAIQFLSDFTQKKIEVSK